MTIPTTTSNTKLKVPLRNPVVGPAERAALQQSQPAVSTRTGGDAEYRPPTPSIAKLQASARNPASHPLIANLLERRDERRLVTPAIARVLLERWNGRNRPFAHAVCSRYATDMKEDHFNPENGTTIGIDFNGDLTDGQNRLAAMVRTGRSYNLLVCSGLDPAARDTVDIGSSRTLGQILALNGVENAEIVGRAARLLFAYEEDAFDYSTPGIPANAQATKAQAEAFIQKNSDELQAAARLVSSRPFRNRWFAPGLTCFFYILFARQSPRRAKLFLYQLASGLQSPLSGATGLTSRSPVYQLRERLLDNQTATRKFRVTHTIGMTLKAWIAERDGKTVRLLTVRQGEHFPDIDEGWKPNPATVAAEAAADDDFGKPGASAAGA